MCGCFPVTFVMEGVRTSQTRRIHNISNPSEPLPPLQTKHKLHKLYNLLWEGGKSYSATLAYPSHNMLQLPNSHDFKRNFVCLSSEASLYLPSFQIFFKSQELHFTIYFYKLVQNMLNYVDIWYFGLCGCSLLCIGDVCSIFRYGAMCFNMRRYNTTWAIHSRTSPIILDSSSWHGSVCTYIHNHYHT